MSSGHERSLSIGHAEKVTEVENHLMRMGYAPGTVEQRVSRLRALPKDPAECTPADILASLPPSAQASTRRVYLGALRSAWRDMLYLGLVSHDPTVGIRIPGVGRRVPRPLMDDEVARLLAGSGRALDWTILGLYAGCRASDVVGMYAEDLIRTRSGAALRMHGKGNVEAVIPAHEMVVQVFSRYPAKGPLWRMRADSMSSKWATWALDQGVSARFHQLRHTFATNVFRQSGDILLTRDLMRHSSVVTTQVYTAVEPEKHYLAVAGL